MSTTSGISYGFDIQGSVVEQLGIKQYDKVSAVVAELVANSYDADAENVDVTLPINRYLSTKQDDEVVDKGFEIIVEDDGHGMDPSEANNKFLRVGRNRRQEEGQTSREKDRPVMGRKGIGKLAPFGLCNVIEIRSAGGEETEDGYEVSHFKMEFEAREGDRGIKNTPADETYEPIPQEDDGGYDDKPGTKVILSDFSRQVKRVPDKTGFSNRLSRRFADGLEDFQIILHDNNPRDEENYGSFDLSETDIPLQDSTIIDATEKPIIDEHGNELEFEDGWMGLSKDPLDGEFAGVAIYVRGKIATRTSNFNIDAGFTGEIRARSYLIGELHCPWLDEENDLIQSNRQELIWESREGQLLQEWGQERIKEIARKSKEPRRKSASEKFLEESNFEDKVDEAFEDEEIREAAVDLGKSLSRHAHEDDLKDSDFLEKFSRIIIQLAPHKHLVDTFRKIQKEAEEGDLDAEDLFDLVDTTSVAEVTSFAQVAQNKMETIEVLSENLSEDVTDEKRYHELVEDAPWLLNPYWVPLTSEKSLSTFRERFEDYYESEYGENLETGPIEEDRKRPDLTLISVDSSIVVVELKPPTHTFDDEDFSRFKNYVRGVENFLEENETFQDKFGNCSEVYLIADEVDLNEDNDDLLQHYARERSFENRFTWDELLERARSQHQEFIEAKR